MKKSTKVLLGICAAALVLVSEALAAADTRTTPSASQGVTRPGPPPLERFVGPLGLTTAQQQKLRPIFAEAQAQAATDLETLKDDSQKPDESQVIAMVKMREADFRERLAAVLTPEQLSRYNQMTAEQMPRERATEQHSAHGHRDADNPATARD
jgi:Spy/CpxP family protein refolding chaperone